MNKLLHPIDDSSAQEEWGEAEYGQELIVDDFIAEMTSNPHRHS